MANPTCPTTGTTWCDDCDDWTESDNRGCLWRWFCAVCGRDRNE